MFQLSLMLDQHHPVHWQRNRTDLLVCVKPSSTNPVLFKGPWCTCTKDCFFLLCSQKRRGSGSSTETDAISDKESDFTGEEGCGKYITLCRLSDLTRKPHLYTWMAASYFYALKFAALGPHLGRLITVKARSDHELKKIDKSVRVNTFMIMAAGSAVTVVIMSCVGRYIKGHLLVVSLVGTMSLALVCLLLALTPPTLETIFLLFCLFGISRELNGVFRYPCSQEVLQMDLANGQALSVFFVGLGIFTSPVFSILMMKKYTQTSLLWMLLGISVIEGLFYIISIFVLKRYLRRENYDDLWSEKRIYAKFLATWRAVSKLFLKTFFIPQCMNIISVSLNLW